MTNSKLLASCREAHAYGACYCCPTFVPYFDELNQSKEYCRHPWGASPMCGRRPAEHPFVDERCAKLRAAVEEAGKDGCARHSETDPTHSCDSWPTPPPPLEEFDVAGWIMGWHERETEDPSTLCARGYCACQGLIPAFTREVGVVYRRKS